MCWSRWGWWSQKEASIIEWRLENSNRGSSNTCEAVSPIRYFYAYFCISVHSLDVATVIIINIFLSHYGSDGLTGPRIHSLCQWRWFLPLNSIHCFHQQLLGWTVEWIVELPLRWKGLLGQLQPQVKNICPNSKLFKMDRNQLRRGSLSAHAHHHDEVSNHGLAINSSSW